MGGLRGASATSNGALFEAVKNNVSFDVDENSVNDLKARQETIKDYREVERAENELNAEVNRIMDSIVSAEMPMSQANNTVELYRAAAIGANPDNPAQWLKDNLNEFVRRETIEDDAYNQAFRMSKKAKAEYAAKDGKQVDGRGRIVGEEYNQTARKSLKDDVEKWENTLNNIPKQCEKTRQSIINCCRSWTRLWLCRWLAFLHFL